jgi:hypothetical protein
MLDVVAFAFEKATEQATDIFSAKLLALAHASFDLAGFDGQHLDVSKRPHGDLLQISFSAATSPRRLKNNLILFTAEENYLNMHITYETGSQIAH